MGGARRRLHGPYAERFAVVAIALLASCAPAIREEPAPGLQRPPARLPEEAPRLPPLLADGAGGAVATAEAWRRRREELRRGWLDFLGELPGSQAPIEMEVLDREDLPAFTRERVRYRIEDGVSTEGYLLTPRGPSGKLPAVAVFHPTVKSEARSVAGLDPESARHAVGPLLAERGYVVLCPRCFIFDDGADAADNVFKMQARHPRWKGMARMLLDARRAADLLASLPRVDPRKIGAFGHSLGAKETLYAAAFDERYRATVFSEGGIGFRFTNWDAIWYLSMEIWEREESLNHHQLLALIAPRAFLLLAGESADGDRSWPFIESALEVYRLLGAGERLGWLNHRKGHSYPPEAHAAAVEFLDRHLKG